MNKKIIILFSIILVLCIIAWYTIYKSYNSDQNNLVVEEEINLGGTACPQITGCDNNEYNKKTKKCVCTKCSSGYKKSGNDCKLIEKTSCDPGRYLRNGSCPKCPAGTYSVGGTATSCTKCDAGTYSTEGARDCTQCRGTLNTSQTACYTCGLSYSKDTNKVTLTYNNNSEVRNTSINGYVSSSITPTYEGKYIGTVYYADGTTCTATTNVSFGCQEGYYKASGSNKCEKCDKGIIVGDSQTGQACCMYGVSFPQKISPNGSATYSIGAPSNSMCPGYTYEIINYGPNFSNILVPISMPDKGATRGNISSAKSCSSVSLTVFVNGVAIDSRTAEVSSDWNGPYVKTFDAAKFVPSTESVANNFNSDYYGTCGGHVNGKKECTVYARTCGGGGQTLYNYCCVNNGTLELSTEARPYESVPEKSCPQNWTLLENVKKEDCKTETIEKGSCDINNIPSPKKTGEADSCESTVSIKVDEGKQCTNTTENTTTNFYEISCAKTVKTGFDYGNDGKTDTIRTLYKGEGFGFGINVETSVNCKYTFFDTVWKAAYNKAMNKIKKIDSNLVQYVEKNQTEEWKTYINNNILNKNGITDVSILYDLWDTIENLQKVVNTYNEYLPSKNYKENGEITLTVNEKGKSVITKHKLISDVKEEGTYKSSEISTNKLGVPLLSDPKSYILSSNTPRKVLLIPKKVCIDKKGNFNTIDGTECPKNTIDGGNKIYTDMATDVTNGNTSYPISIKVEGLGSNDSSVTNDKCNLKIIESKYIYRPIDVSNPFISNSWQKGKNWVNETFDFTKVINKDTWQDNSKRKVITLTAKDIAKLKESNAKAWRDGNSPYLGLCISQEETLQYEITKKLCSMIK